MIFESQHVCHIFNEGNNKEPIFLIHEDYAMFLQLTKKYIIPHCDVLAWCLLPNHFHFMIASNENSLVTHKQGHLPGEKLSNGFRKLLSIYAHQFNKANDRYGSLFSTKIKATDLSANALRNTSGSNNYLDCFYYIHQNPLQHGLVSDLNQWIYSSFDFYCGKRKKDICNRQLAIDLCGYNANTFLPMVHKSLPDDCASFFDND